MKNTLIYHNPRCRKSRETLDLLKEEGIEPTIVHYLDDHLSLDDLTHLTSLLDIEPLGLLRKGEAAYKELKAEGKLETNDDALQAMANHPKLIERPIVVHNNAAAIGRPPETVLTLFK